MIISNKRLSALIPRLANKLKLDRGMSYRICAAAYSKRGNLLGTEMNGYRDHLSSRKGAGKHAEASIIKKYGKQIDTIYILRVGRACDVLPIHPCENCAKLAKKYGIKIIPIHEEIDNPSDFVKK
jgi:deoxycytidylate deaminase